AASAAAIGQDVRAASAPADPAALVATLRRRTWASLGLERTGEGLRGLLDEIAGWSRDVSGRPRGRAAAEARKLVAVADAMAVCALFREESRGAHFRLDFPLPDDARFLGHTVLASAGPVLAPVDAVPGGRAA